jgi:predicted nucleic acid-binding protein
VSAASPAFFDTNVLVYMVDAGEPRKRDRARELFFEHAATGSVVLSTQVLLEFYWASTHGRRSSYPPRAAAGLIRHLAAFAVVSPPRESVVAAVERAAATGMPVWDALIVEAAALAGARVIYSEDRHLHSAAAGLSRDVRVIDPFAGI